MENINLNINGKIAQRPKLAKKEMEKAKKALVSTILTVIFLAVLVFAGYKFLKFFLKHPDFKVKRVQILNNITITPKQILNIVSVGTNQNIYAASINSYVKRLENHPDIKTAIIKKAHPDKIIIKVIEREPVAVIMSVGTKCDVSVDCDGVILSDNKMKYALELPKIVGIKPGFYRPGTVIKDKRVLNALKFADTIRTVYQNTFVDIKKISLDNSQHITFKSASVEEILVGNEWNLNLVIKLLAVIDDLRFQRINAQKIDLRFNDIAVTPKPM